MGITPLKDTKPTKFKMTAGVLSRRGRKHVYSDCNLGIELEHSEKKGKRPHNPRVPRSTTGNETHETVDEMDHSYDSGCLKYQVDCPSFSSNSHSADEPPHSKCRRFYQLFLRRYGSRMKSRSLSKTRVVAENTSTFIETKDVHVDTFQNSSLIMCENKPQTIRINEQASIVYVPYSCFDDENMDSEGNDELHDKYMVRSLSNSLKKNRQMFVSFDDALGDDFHYNAYLKVDELAKNALSAQRHKFRCYS